MRKSQKFILIIMILLMFLAPNFYSLNVKALEPKRGDLRCPTGDLPSNVKCVEKKNSNGIVTEVEITYGSFTNPGDIEIKKTVKRMLDGDEGHYKVGFTVRGKSVSQIKTSSDAYVILIYDTSATMSDEKKAKSAIKSFARTLLEDNEGNINLGFYQFATNISSRTRGFSTKNLDSYNICGYKECSMQTQSRLDKAYSKAISWFKDKSKNADDQKIIVLFGDGRYHIGNGGKYTGGDNDTDWKAVKKNLTTLHDLGTEVFGVRYQAGYGSSYYGDDKKYMTMASDHYYEAKNPKDYEKVLKDVAEKVKQTIEENSSSYVTDLLDNLGLNFYFTSDVGDWKKFGVGKIDEEGYKSPEFEIEIDRFASQGWHDTNNGFSLSYTNENGDEKTIKVDYNPQVYWEPDKTNIPTCNGTARVGGIRKDDSDPYQFFTVSCVEGYQDAKGTHDLEVSAYVKDIPTDNNKVANFSHFNISAGLGFPSYLKIQTGVRCSYKFNVNEFTERYNMFKRGLTSSDPKEQASALKQLLKLEPYITQYLNAVEHTDLDKYMEDFEKQSATMTISYKNKNNEETGEDKFSFENIKDSFQKNLSCSVSSYETINYDVNGSSKSYRVPKEQTCNLSLQKEMQLKSSCLDMKTGEQTECLPDSNFQIDGGNNVYTRLKETNGEIKINLPNMGINQNVDIALKKVASNEEACTFESDNKLSNITYRQIKLSDPFIQELNKERGIGRNYYNDSYDFTNIIASDLWDADKAGNLKYASEYKYLMGKKNIDNIRKDSREEGVNSYLGRSCYFSLKYSSDSTKEKYICDFTRNNDTNSYNKDFFTSAKFADE